MSFACSASLHFFFPVGFIRSPIMTGPAVSPTCRALLYEHKKVLLCAFESGQKMFFVN